MRRKIIFVGLDGAEPELLQKWSNEGVLPHMKKLLKESAWMEPQTPAPFGDGVFWPAFFTAAGPAKHGRYFRSQIVPGTYSCKRFDEDKDFTHETLWRLASDAGRKVAVIDMPKAPLKRGLNGVQLVDWIVHDRCGRTRSHPAALAPEITERFGKDPNDGNVGVEPGERRTPAATEALSQQLLWRVDAKRRACLHLLQEEDFDLFMVAFQEAHDIGHQCWHLHDPGHPLHREWGIDTMCTPVKDVYRALDQAVGELAARAGDNHLLVVVAGLGMGPSYTGNYLLDGILKSFERNGRDASYVRRQRGIFRLLPIGVRDRLRAVTFTAEGVRAEERRRRKFFAIPHNQNAGAIRINLVGREPDGRVKPGYEFDELCEQLSAKLKSLTNADTGGPVVDEVVKISERFAGPHLDRLPDLLVVWNRSAPIHAIRGPGIEETPRKPLGPRTGDHTQRALALVRGPGIEARRVEGAVSIMDLGATVAALLEVSIRDSDGEPIAQLAAR